MNIEELNTNDTINGAQWYVLSVLPQHEISIRDKLLGLAQNTMFKDLIEDVRVASEFVETKSGKTKEKVGDFTNYVFVKMIHNDITYNAVKIQGVLHILGAPTPMTLEEVQNLFGEI